MTVTPLLSVVGPRATGSLAFLTLACAVLVPLLLAYREPAAAEASAGEERTFVVTSPLRADTLARRAYVAELKGAQHVELRAQVSGVLQELFVDESRSVRQGEPLLHIDRRPLEAELASAAARLAAAEADVSLAEIDAAARTTLHEKGIVAGAELDIARAQVAAAQAGRDEAAAALAEARLRLEYAEVRAPFDGRISLLPHKPGSLVDEGDLLTTLTDGSEMLAYFRVSEREFLELTGDRQGTIDRPVGLELVDGTLYEHLGRIESWDPVVSRSTGSITCRARFPNPEQLLLHGATGKVILESPLEGALLIPQRSTFEVQDRLSVFVVDGQGTVALRRVVPAHRLTEHFVLHSGLEPDERFLFDGIQHVREGDVIATSFVAPVELAPL